MREVRALEFKPDFSEAARRWAAFYEGEIIDRPLVRVKARQTPGKPSPPKWSYHDLVFGDIDEVIGRALETARGTYWGGEAVPSFNASFGPDEVAVFTGAELRWNDDSGDTNWAVPYVEDWRKAGPIRIREDSPLWRRKLEVHARSAEKVKGRMLVEPPDLHTNMDLLAAIRGPQRLCLDLVDSPDEVEGAMAEARALFPALWDAVRKAGRMDETGYFCQIYAPDGAAMLECDFICMVGPEMFRRFVLPALEEEARIVKHVFFHWDGPGALKHMEDIIACRGFDVIDYVPGEGQGGHIENFEILRRLQAGGRAVFASGTPEEVKAMHRKLAPERVVYATETQTPAEAEALLRWFAANT